MKRGLKFTICFVIIVTCALLVLTGCNKEELESIYKPTNISYDGARITWNRVELAEHYTVQVNGGEPKRVNTNMFDYKNDGGAFEVTVNAVIGDKSIGETITFTPLDRISSISVADNGTISWQAVAGATAYKVNVNGTEIDGEISDTSYTPAPGSSKIKVRAVVSGDNSYYSLWSDEKKLFINHAPTQIKYDGAKLSWLGNASTYNVNINGLDNIITGNTFDYNSGDVDFSVKIRALGDHATTFDSPDVEESFYFLQPVSDMVIEDGILNWGAIQNAEGYSIRINGVVQKQTTKTTSYENLSAGTSLDIEVKPFNNSNNYFSKWSSVMNVYILESPVVSWNADLELDGEANNNFIWNSVNGAVGYCVEVEKDGQVEKHDFPISQMAFTYAYTQVGIYNVKVKAIAELGNDYYDSKFSTPVVVERLAAPKGATENFVKSNATDLKSGFTVNYTSVNGATGYQLYKDGTVLDGKYSTTLSISDYDVADESVSSEQNYTYMVRSIGTVKTVNSKTYATLSCLSSQALSFNVTVLAMPTSTTMSGFMLEWQNVAGTDGYGVKYGGSIVVANSTQYNLSTIKAGNYDVSVCAKGNGSTTLASNYTAPIVVNRLIAPLNIKISYGTGEGQLQYDSVANAKSYQVYLDESSQALPENAFDNMYQYIRETGTVLHMISVANYYNDMGTVYYMTSEASPTQQFVRLAAPTFPDGVFANSSEMVWNAPDNINTAEYTPTYEVWEGNLMQNGQQNGTKFNIKYLDGGETYTFQVKAIGNDTKYLDSEFSVAKSIYKLATPEFHIEDNKYVWSGVTNASSYVLEIDGVRVNNDIHVSGDTYSYTPYYTTIGKHKVVLYAVGDGYTTINSDNFEYTQVVKSCLAPEISFAYSNTSFINGGSINVYITTESANNNGYLYEIAGDSITSVNLFEEKSIESTGTYYIRVKALGGKIDANEIYYVDSQFTGGNSGYSITLLAPPTVNTFSVNADGAVRWATITGAMGYDYQISYNGGEYTNVEHTGTASLNPITNIKDYSTIRIRVKACGNGDNIITSDWVEYIWTNPNK